MMMTSCSRRKRKFQVRYMKSWEFYDCTKYKDLGDLIKRTCMVPVCNFWSGLKGL